VATALPERGVLCHGDLHGLNVILTPKGPRIIDWMSVLDAPALVDVARHHVTLTLCVPDGAQYDPIRPFRCVLHARICAACRDCRT
jgi:aminoglycoside phosphotransferase (APT) family kinase protein